jgi:hypothetical protein
MKFAILMLAVLILVPQEHVEAAKQVNFTVTTLPDNTTDFTVITLPDTTFTFDPSRYVINTTTVFGNFPSPVGFFTWFPVIMGSFLPLVALIVFLFYIYARLTGNYDLRESAAEELNELVFSVIIAALVYAGAVTNLYGMLGMDWVYRQCLNYYHELGGWLATLYSAVLLFKVALNALAEPLTTVLKEGGQVALFVPLVGQIFGAAALAIAGAVKALNGFAQDTLKNVLKYLMNGLTIVLAMKMLLAFAQTYVIPYFLPMGIVMRAISPTRRAGAALMGFALSMFFVFPVVTYAGVLIVDDLSKRAIAGISGGLITVDSSGNLHLGISSLSYRDIIPDPTDPQSVYMSPAALPIRAFHNVAVFLLVAVGVVPAVSILITFVSIMGMAKFFGGELRLKPPFRMF